jgi:UDP-glucose 4-epimerase
MRVVITGATGNVGTSLIEALADTDEVTTVLGLARRAPEWAPAKTQWAEADVEHDDLMVLFADADAVVHLAWQLQPTHKPYTTWKANVAGTARVLEAVSHAHVPTLVCASSWAAYSPGPKERLIDESWPTHGWPTAAYTREKAYTERLLDHFECANPQCRVVRLRPAFIFKRASAAQQRRLFAGPLLPSPLLRPGLIPIVPDFPGLRLQALHAYDAAQAYRLALLRPVRGAFNLAADPVLDAGQLAGLLNARTVRVPQRLVRAATAMLWQLRLVPSSPHLVDAILRLPPMSTERARLELGWEPRHSSKAAIAEFLNGVRTESGMNTPPLAPSPRARVLPHDVRGSDRS